MTTLTLAHDLVLLSLDPETGHRRRAQYVGYGVVGALLAELALAKCVDLEGKKVHVIDPSPTGEPRTDDLLGRLLDDKERTPQAWAQKLRGTYSKDLLEDLCTAEIVHRDASTFLRMWDTSRYPQLGGARRDRLMGPLRDVMVGGLTPSDPSAARIVALGALVVAVDLQGRVFPGIRKRDLKRRLGELEQAGWAGEGVRKAIAAATPAGAGSS